MAKFEQWRYDTTLIERLHSLSFFIMERNIKMGDIFLLALVALMAAYTFWDKLFTD